MEEKTVWHKGLFEVNLLMTKTDKAIKIKMPSYSLYSGYVTWIPQQFVQSVFPNQDNYYQFYLPTHFEVKLYLEDSTRSIVDTKIVSATYLEKIFSTLTYELEKELGLISNDEVDIINVTEIKELLSSSLVSTEDIASNSGLSQQTILRLQKDINRLEGMKLSNLRKLKQVVALYQKGQ
ncbi:TPA: hypothetical protein ACQ0F8_001628 [Streptococcus agalactiae]|nr:hypothetical protein [Streptococcus agalactiae]HEO4177360.1 hypothetical protein [Streptococcus agalactiae]